MTTTEHLAFLALMIPTFVLLILAAISLADPQREPPRTAQAAVVAAQKVPVHLSVRPPAPDEERDETAY